MIKNKILNIKFIYKTYLKIYLKHFKFSNRILFYKTLQNSFQKQFLKLGLIFQIRKEIKYN